MLVIMTNLTLSVLASFYITSLACLNVSGEFEPGLNVSQLCDPLLLLLFGNSLLQSVGS